MSYNINSIDIVSSDSFCIPRPKLDELAASLSAEAPEISVLDERYASDACEEHRGMLFPTRFDWCGESSGRQFETLRDRVLPAFLGRADLVLTWEGGDSHTGLRLVNGIVTEHEVTLSLGKVK